MAKWRSNAICFSGNFLLIASDFDDEEIEVGLENRAKFGDRPILIFGNDFLCQC